MTDTEIRKAKPREKDFKLTDGGGLYLLVKSTGSKLWRLDYRIDGKRKTLALGSYPTVPLADARSKREEAKKLLAKDVDPGDARKAEKVARALAGAESLEAIAREWHTKQKGVWSEIHAKTVLGRLELDVFPILGKRPIADIKAPELLAMLRRIESRRVT